MPVLTIQHTPLAYKTSAILENYFAVYTYRAKG